MPKLKDFTKEQLESLEETVIDDDGYEIVNPVPMEVPFGLNQPETMEQKLMRFALAAQEQQALAQQIEEDPVAYMEEQLAGQPGDGFFQDVALTQYEQVGSYLAKKERMRVRFSDIEAPALGQPAHQMEPNDEKDPAAVKKEKQVGQPAHQKEKKPARGKEVSEPKG